MRTHGDRVPESTSAKSRHWIEFMTFSMFHLVFCPWHLLTTRFHTSAPETVANAMAKLPRVPARSRPCTLVWRSIDRTQLMTVYHCSRRSVAVHRLARKTRD